MNQPTADRESLEQIWNMDFNRKLEVDLEPRLADRIRAVCEFLNISVESFAAFAIEQEIVRQEIHMVKDEITIQEIDKNVLRPGLSLTIHLIDQNDELSRQINTCQMCLTEFDEPLNRVEGPLFCDDCLSMARGGDFTGLGPRS